LRGGEERQEISTVLGPPKLKKKSPWLGSYLVVVLDSLKGGKNGWGLKGGGAHEEKKKREKVLRRRGCAKEEL